VLGGAPANIAMDCRGREVAASAWRGTLMFKTEAVILPVDSILRQSTVGNVLADDPTSRPPAKNTSDRASRDVEAIAKRGMDRLTGDTDQDCVIALKTSIRLLAIVV
jgi:hypothetical protein